MYGNTDFIWKKFYTEHWHCWTGGAAVSQSPLISIIVPMYNEGLNINSFLKE